MHIVSKSLPLDNTWSPSRRVGVAPLVKTLLVEALCRTSNWRRQDRLARIVRSVWPEFHDA